MWQTWTKTKHVENDDEEIPHFNFNTDTSGTTTVQYVGVLTWKSRFKNSLAKALFTLQIW